MRTPAFWYDRPGPAAALLAPLGHVYDAAGRLRRALVAPRRAAAPVICIGNLVAGGAGKTPVALAVARRLRDRGIDVQFLTRGYGGREAGPLRVDPARHDAADVGDEPLLLAAAAPTWVARDRVAGAAAATAAGARAIVMDDGFQNPTLHKDAALLVVDGATGYGNGRLIPAGPLRETPAAGLGRATALVVLGDDRHGLAAAADAAGLPVLHARIVPAAPERWAGRPVVAFAGIARPEKFFATLDGMGARRVESFAFEDHHRFRPEEIERMRRAADDAGATLVTTTKDLVRLPPATRAAVQALEIAVAWRDPAALDRALDRVLGTTGRTIGDGR